MSQPVGVRSGWRRMLPLLALFVYLTFLGGSVYSDLNSGLRLFHQLLVTLLLGVWLLNLWRQGDGWPAVGLEWSTLVFMAIRFITVWTGINPRMSAELFWRPLTHAVGFYWLVWLFRRQGWGLLVRVFYLTAGVVCLIGLIEFAGWYFGLPFLPIYQQGWWQIGGLADPIPPTWLRLNFTLSSATSLSTYLSLLIPPALAMALAARRRDGRIVWLGWVAAALVVQVLSQSRGGLLALLISLPLFAAGLLRGRFEGVRQALLSKWLRLALVVALLVFVIVAALLLPRYLGRTSTVEVRFELWRCALQMVADRPLTGVGIGIYGQALRGCLAVHSGRFEQFTTAHNFYLNLAAESGLLALAAFVWLAAGLTQLAWRRWRAAQSEQERLLVLGIVAALAGYAANCLVDTLTATPLVFPVLFLSAWLATPLEAIRPSRPARWPILAGLAILLGYAAVLGWMDWGQQHFERSRRAAGQGDWQTALSEIDQARQLDPAMGLYRFQRAYYLGRLAEDEPELYLGSAVQAAAEALALDDSNSLHLANLAVLHWQAGNMDEALVAMERAVAANPPDPVFSLNLGLMAEEAGRSAQAMQAYAAALAAQPHWAASDFWDASAFRQRNRRAILSAALEVGANPGPLWLAAGELDRAQAAVANPVDALDWIVLARLRWQQGQLEGAMLALDTLVEQCPSCAGGYALRARVAWELGLSEQALRDAQTALFISPYGASNARTTLGLMAQSAGDTARARDHFWRAMPAQFVSQNWEVVLFNRRATLLPLPQLVTIGGGPAEAEPWLALAELYLAEGQPEQAAEVYALLLARDPYAADVRQRLDNLTGNETTE